MRTLAAVEEVISRAGAAVGGAACDRLSGRAAASSGGTPSCVVTAAPGSCYVLGPTTSPDHRRRQATGKAGSQYLFVAIDDCSRLGFAVVHPNEISGRATGFLDELVPLLHPPRHRRGPGLTDNGACVKRRWTDACNAHSVMVKKTRPPSPDQRLSDDSSARRSSAGLTPTRTPTISTPRGPRSRTRLLQSFRPHRTLKGLTPLQHVCTVPGTNR